MPEDRQCHQEQARRGQNMLPVSHFLLSACNANLLTAHVCIHIQSMSSLFTQIDPASGLLLLLLQASAPALGNKPQTIRLSASVWVCEALS